MITGLPRTGTTSVCFELLQLGYRVCHTAFTQAACEQAQVLADTPVFSDYAELQPRLNADLWLHTERQPALWLASIRQLFSRMTETPNQRIQPLVWRSFQRVFGDIRQPFSDQQLLAIYHQQQQSVQQQAQFFGVRLVAVEFSSSINQPTLAQVLDGKESGRWVISCPHHLNLGRVFAWGEVKHPNKVSSHLAGPHRRAYFDYSVAGK